MPALFYCKNDLPAWDIVHAVSDHPLLFMCKQDCWRNPKELSLLRGGLRRQS